MKSDQPPAGAKLILSIHVGRRRCWGVDELASEAPSASPFLSKLAKNRSKLSGGH